MAMRKAIETEDEPLQRKRFRRTEEQLIHDLEAKLEHLRQRAAAKSAKNSAAMKATLGALRAIDKAVDAATAEDDTALRHVLADARNPLEHHLEAQGIKIQKTRRPKGPRPKPG